MATMLRQTDKMTASYEDSEIAILIKTTGTMRRIDATENPRPVTSRTYLDALAKQGIDPATRRMLGDVCMSTDDADAVVTAVCEIPEVRMQILRKKRRALVDAIGDEMDRIGAARERGYQEDLGRIPSYNSPRYRETTSVLAVWDAAHPDVIKAIEAEKQAAVERHIWD